MGQLFLCLNFFGLVMESACAALVSNVKHDDPLFVYITK